MRTSAAEAFPGNIWAAGSAPVGSSGCTGLTRPTAWMKAGPTARVHTNNNRARGPREAVIQSAARHRPQKVDHAARPNSAKLTSSMAVTRGQAQGKQPWWRLWTSVALTTASRQLQFIASCSRDCDALSHLVSTHHLVSTMLCGVTLALGLTMHAPALRPAAAHLRSRALCMGGPQEVDDTWTTTSSGLQYLDISPGSGECPQSGNVVKVDYTGWLESSGKEFDSSIGRAPIAFSVDSGRVIPGWDEGILTMRPGGKRRLSIPADLAYGEEGTGTIPGGSRLQFECEVRAARFFFCDRRCSCCCSCCCCSCFSLSQSAPAPCARSSSESRPASTPSSPPSRVGCPTSSSSRSSSSAASRTSCRNRSVPARGPREG